MADVDTRRDHGGGGGFRQNGGGGRNYGGNKRKRGREDDDIEQGRPDRRPRHSEAPPGTRLRRALLEIGDDPLRLPQEVAQNAAKLATENYEDEYVRDTFCTVALKLVIEQPFKIPMIAGVVQYANADNSEVAKDIISKAASQLQEYLDGGQWRELKLMLRLIACLSPLYEEDGVLPVLDELFNRAVDLQTASQEDAVGLELVKIILLTVPYLLASNGDATLQQAASELLARTDIVASAQNPLEPLEDPYPDATSQEEKPMACASVISLLQRQLQDEDSNGWPLKCIPRVYDSSFMQGDTNGNAPEGTKSDEEAKSAPKHAFPIINVPSTVNPGPKALFPEIYFSLYADQEIESVPPTSDIAACLLRDAVLDTINILDFNRNATARFLNDIDCYWAPDTFVKRSTAFDKLRDMPAGKSTWKPEDVAIDTIFSQIFRLPTPEHRLVYYHSLITESATVREGVFLMRNKG